MKIASLLALFVPVVLAAPTDVCGANSQISLEKADVTITVYNCKQDCSDEYDKCMQMCEDNHVAPALCPWSVFYLSFFP